MLRAKAAYAQGRKLVDVNFTAFIEKIVGDVECPKTLSNGQTLFEAVMGFLKLHKN
jgi:CRISPR-associated protein Csm2